MEVLNALLVYLLASVQHCYVMGISIAMISVMKIHVVGLPGSSDKRLTGNGEKLTYSPAVDCNWLCLAGVYYPSFSRGTFI